MAKKIGIDLLSLLQKGKIRSRFDADTYMKHVKDKVKDGGYNDWHAKYYNIYFGSTQELYVTVLCDEDGLPAQDEVFEFYSYNRNEYIWEQIKYKEFIDKVFKALEKDIQEEKARSIRKAAAELAERNQRLYGRN
jgi:hypothetical protein